MDDSSQEAIHSVEWYKLAMGEGPRTFLVPEAWQKWPESAAQFFRIKE